MAKDDLERELGSMICSFCGWKLIGNSLTAVAEHMLACEKHPIRPLFESHARLLAAAQEAARVLLDLGAELAENPFYLKTLAQLEDAIAQAQKGVR